VYGKIKPPGDLFFRGFFYGLAGVEKRRSGEVKKWRSGEVEKWRSAERKGKKVWTCNKKVDIWLRVLKQLV
jgi:hypothetical protein